MKFSHCLHKENIVNFRLFSRNVRQYSHLPGAPVRRWRQTEILHTINNPSLIGEEAPHENL